MHFLGRKGSWTCEGESVYAHQSHGCVFSLKEWEALDVLPLSSKISNEPRVGSNLHFEDWRKLPNIAVTKVPGGQLEEHKQRC